ncbi:MAG TPA: DUF4215 domain-containing protein [Myxococcota bacterium]|jgi:cysteine-rich repeat protein|nr:DUF4215 domain-containing protein [Myxococcota bacterium]
MGHQRGTAHPTLCAARAATGFTIVSVLAGVAAAGAALPGCAHDAFVTVTVSTDIAGIDNLHVVLAAGVRTDMYDFVATDADWLVSGALRITNFAAQIPHDVGAPITFTVTGSIAGVNVATGAATLAVLVRGSNENSVTVDLDPISLTCGNGTVEPPEECDDGNTVDDDACNNNCQNNVSLTCGDGTTDPPLEECDDANTVDGDDCTNDCRTPFCGDGVVWNAGSGLEQCDDGDPASNLGGCYPDCTAPGNGPAIGGLFGDYKGIVIHGPSDDASLGAWFGATPTSVVAGDFDGDGIDDLAVAAPAADTVNGFESGAVFIVPGGDYAPGKRFDTATPPDGALDPVVGTILGATGGDNIGIGLAAGDFDGDGLADLAIGAPAAGGGTGAIYLLHSAPGMGLSGTFDLAAGAAYATILGIDSAPPGGEQADSLGAGLAAGDVDGNGTVDLVAGAFGANGPGETRTDGGEAYIFASVLAPGTFTDASIANGILYGLQSGDLFGFAVAVADLTGDGVDDVAVSAPNADGPGGSRVDAGEAYIFAGEAGLVPPARDVANGEQLVTIYGAEASDILVHLAVGDLNGDGANDLAMDAFGADGPANTRLDSGNAYVVFGPWTAAGTTLDLSTPVPVVVNFPSSGGAGLPGGWPAFADWDRDGDDDLMVAAPGTATPYGTGVLGLILGGSSVGSTYDLDTGAGGTAPDILVYNEVAISPLWGPVAAGDVNHDGFGDFAVAVPAAAAGAMLQRVGAGRVVVLFGGPGVRPPGECLDGLDNDADGLTDYPGDPGCASLGDTTETADEACGNGLDDDGDGLFDWPVDPGCDGPLDDSETDPATPPQCANGADDDGDGYIDFGGGDPGCSAASDDLEQEEICGNGFDDDANGDIDCADAACAPLPSCTTGGAYELFTGMTGDTFDLSFATIVFSYDPLAGDYNWAASAGGPTFPYAPGTGNLLTTTLPLGDESFMPMTLPAGASVPFYGTSYSTVFVCSNGYVTFTGGDSIFTPSPDLMFSYMTPNNFPRIAPLWDDLDEGPVGAGTIYFDVFGPASSATLVVTWNGVWEYSTTMTPNTFQMAITSTGTITFSYQGISTVNGLVGVAPANTTGLPPPPESNFF